MMDTWLCVIAPAAFLFVAIVFAASFGSSLRRFTGAAMADRLLRLDEVER